jgi:RimJ/RimL family protein N-acetyltransferase
MEKMPYCDETEPMVAPGLNTDDRASASVEGWRRALPSLEGASVTLRELRSTDARSLFAMLSTAEVGRFISPPPTTMEGFERFIEWTQRERAAGNYVCFGIVPKGLDVAVGLIQVRRLEPQFATAEWGFVLGSSFWGTGIFAEGAQLVVDFVFGVIGVHRLEARAAMKNGRGNGALRKLGATAEGILRRSFLRNGQYLDQVLWTILASDWSTLRAPCGPSVH